MATYLLATYVLFWRRQPSAGLWRRRRQSNCEHANHLLHHSTSPTQFHSIVKSSNTKRINILLRLRVHHFTSPSSASCTIASVSFLCKSFNFVLDVRRFFFVERGAKGREKGQRETNTPYDIIGTPTDTHTQRQSLSSILPNNTTKKESIPAMLCRFQPSSSCVCATRATSQRREKKTPLVNYTLNVKYMLF